MNSPISNPGKINLKHRAKRARQLARYSEWKQKGVGFNHFEIFGIYPAKKPGASCSVRRVGRQLAFSAGEALDRAQKGLSLCIEKGATLFVLERFDPKKAQVLNDLRKRLQRR